MAICNKEASRITPGITSIDMLVDMDSPICEARPIVTRGQWNSSKQICQNDLKDIKLSKYWCNGCA